MDIQTSAETGREGIRSHYKERGSIERPQNYEAIISGGMLEFGLLDEDAKLGQVYVSIRESDDTKGTFIVQEFIDEAGSRYGSETTISAKSPDQALYRTIAEAYHSSFALDSGNADIRRLEVAEERDAEEVAAKVSAAKIETLALIAKAIENLKGFTSEESDEPVPNSDRISGEREVTRAA